MPGYSYDRLSAQDLTFLLAEDEHSPMHVGAIAIVESGPLVGEDGAFDQAGFRVGWAKSCILFIFGLFFFGKANFFGEEELLRQGELLRKR